MPKKQAGRCSKKHVSLEKPSLSVGIQNRKSRGKRKVSSKFQSTDNSNYNVDVVEVLSTTKPGLTNGINNSKRKSNTNTKPHADSHSLTSSYDSVKKRSRKRKSSLLVQESADEKLPASKGVEKRKGRSKKGKPESSDQSCLFSADEANVIEISSISDSFSPNSINFHNYSEKSRECLEPAIEFTQQNLKEEKVDCKLESPVKRSKRRLAGRPQKHSSEPFTSSESVHSSIQKPYDPSEPLRQNDHPTVVISKYCKLMYELGWATGTGGGMSVKDGNTIYMAPSGVQKEMIEPKDIFECNCLGDVVSAPKSPLKMTECAPLFMNAYLLRNAGAVIHSHGIHAVLASLLFKGKEFRITRIEMIKGIKKGMTNEPYKYDDTLVVPIVENDLYERNLTNRMKIAMEMYPESNAVLVRRHGIYVWGTTWQRAKSQAECYHYLFEAAVKMRQMGLYPDEFNDDEYGITDVN